MQFIRLRHDQKGLFREARGDVVEYRVAPIGEFRPMKEALVAVHINGRLEASEISHLAFAHHLPRWLSLLSELAEHVWWGEHEGIRFRGTIVSRTPTSQSGGRTPMLEPEVVKAVIAAGLAVEAAEGEARRAFAVYEATRQFHEEGELSDWWEEEREGEDPPSLEEAEAALEAAKLRREVANADFLLIEAACRRVVGGNPIWAPLDEETPKAFRRAVDLLISCSPSSPSWASQYFEQLSSKPLQKR